MRRGGFGRRGPGMGGMGRRRMRRHTRRVRRRRRRRRRRILLAGGLLAFGAYKLSKRDAQRVEEYTGKPAEELTDEQLEQAMDQLGIDKQTLTDEDQAYVEQQESEDASSLDEIERLGKLRDQGYISDEEFEMKKKQLLGL